MPYFEGPPTAKLAIIGEAPGIDEVRQGRPFVGRAGKMLNDILRRANINRADCWIDNLFQFHPPKDDLSPWIKIQDSGKASTKPEYDQARAELFQRLAAIKPNVVVPLGNIAMFALTGMDKITKRRGSIYWSEELGCKIIPTIHPSAILHGQVQGKDPDSSGEYLYFHLITLDLRRAAQQSLFPDRRQINRNLILAPSFEEAIDFINSLHDVESFAFDIEVRLGEVSHISLAPTPFMSMSIPFIDGPNDVFSPDRETALWLALTKVLENPNVRKLTQNGTFDATFLFRKYGIRVSPIDDTMVAMAILYPDFPKGLDMIQSIYCAGEPYYKDEGKLWHKNPFATEESFRRYNAMDSAVVAEAFPIMLNDLKRQGNLETYKNQVRLIEPLIFLCEHGIAIDTSMIQQLATSCRQNIKDLEAQIAEKCGSDFNPASPQQVQNYFYITKGLKPYTTKGRITADEKALQRIARKGYEEAQLILDLRGHQKLLGTYLEIKLDEDQRMRGFGNPVGTKQGRISSSKTIFGTGGNLQNMAPEFSSMLHADPGHIIVLQDLAQAENRVVAYVANEPRMMEAFAAKHDIHRETAAMIFDVPLADVTSEQRQWGKKCNHALNYGMGYRQFSLLWQIPEPQAEALRTKYMAVYPGIPCWHERIRNDLRNNGSSLTNIFGRKRVFLDQWGDRLFKAAYSFPAQSAVADLMNAFGVCLLYEKTEEAILLNQIHDSIIYELPISLGAGRISDLIWEVKHNLESRLQAEDRTFYIPVDTKIGFYIDPDRMSEFKAANPPTASDIQEIIERGPQA